LSFLVEARTTWAARDASPFIFVRLYYADVVCQQNNHYITDTWQKINWTMCQIPAPRFPCDCSLAAMVARRKTMSKRVDWEFIERSLWIAEQGFRVRRPPQTRAALEAMRKELAPQLAPNSLKRARTKRAG
jgi:hypothetical protein